MRRLFIPGCALASYSPRLTLKTYDYLKKHSSDIAIAQKCCGKPTKLIGQEDLFNERFNGLIEELNLSGAEQVITACSGCFHTLSGCGSIEIVSLWDVIKEIGLPEECIQKAGIGGISFSIFDACATRTVKSIHDSTRWILEQLGYGIIPSEHERENTFCCGYGGMVGASAPEISKEASKRCIVNFKSEYIAVYCSTCRSSFLSSGGKAWHLLDLLWDGPVNARSVPPADALASPARAWVNRYKTKVLMKKYS